MLDRPADTPDYNFGRLALAAGYSMLCLAPHPDDEVIGCGGLLALAQRQGLATHCAIVTSGQEGVSAEGAASGLRLAESEKAAQVLGLPPPTCWHFTDRQLRCGPALINRIVEELRERRPRWMLLPALTEPHPDHQALALAGMAAARQLNADVDLLFYEVGAPSQPNTLVDVTSVAALKWEALQAFNSQEERHPYRSHAQALAALRAFGAGAGVEAAEAFWHLPAEALQQPDAVAAMAFWPMQRQALGLAADSDQLPLVSVIIRSMNRPSLKQAIASLAAQSYPNIEVLVVNASGAAHPLPAHPPHRLAVRVVDPVVQLGSEAHSDTCQAMPRLGRSAAANQGLDACNGRYAIFLDDDDHVSPRHLERLVEALQSDGQAVAAYSGVRVEGANGQWVRDYDMPWEPRRLRGVNYLPIHAVLFRLHSVRVAGACFDVNLPVLEDWDFWCQLSRLGHFVHVPGISATYRQGLGNSHLGDLEHDNHWAKWHLRILEQHAQRWGWRDQSASLAWHAIALDRADQTYLATERTLGQVQDALNQATALQQQFQGQNLQLTTDLEQARHQSLQLQAERDQSHEHVALLKVERDQHLACIAQLQAELDLAQRSLTMLQQSRPVRWARALRRMLGRGA